MSSSTQTGMHSPIGHSQPSGAVTSQVCFNEARFPYYAVYGAVPLSPRKDIWWHLRCSYIFFMTPHFFSRARFKNHQWTRSWHIYPARPWSEHSPVLAKYNKLLSWSFFVMVSPRSHLRLHYDLHGWVLDMFALVCSFFHYKQNQKPPKKKIIQTKVYLFPFWF